jgi:hypothetical protein
MDVSVLVFWRYWLDWTFWKNFVHEGGVDEGADIVVG